MKVVKAKIEREDGSKERMEKKRWWNQRESGNKERVEAKRG